MVESLICNLVLSSNPCLKIASHWVVSIPARDKPLHVIMSLNGEIMHINVLNMVLSWKHHIHYSIEVQNLELEVRAKA